MNTKEALRLMRGRNTLTIESLRQIAEALANAFAALPERLWTVPKIEWEFRESFDGRPFFQAKAETQVQVIADGVRWYWRLHPNHDRLNFSGYENTLEQAQAAAEAAYVAYITRGLVEVKREE